MKNRRDEFEEAVQNVFDRLFAMDTEEFHSRLRDHKDGDISRALLETGALEVYQHEGWDEDWRGLNSTFISYVWNDTPVFLSSTRTSQVYLSAQFEVLDLTNTWVHFGKFKSVAKTLAAPCDLPTICARSGRWDELNEADDYNYSVAA